MPKNKLPEDRLVELLAILNKRFEKHPERHPNLTWESVVTKLAANEEAFWTLNEMEESGGEPDVVALPSHSGQLIFVDCAAESPKGRRSYCYDQAALESRKEHKPKDSAIHSAEEMGIKILSEQEYAELQQLGTFDLKTSSWLETPAEIRKLGGAIFGDLRFGRVFTYHNGAESYYAARGYRGMLLIK